MFLKLLTALSTVWCNTARKLLRLPPEDDGIYMEKIIQCFLAMVIFVQIQWISLGSYSASLVKIMSLLIITLNTESREKGDLIWHYK